MGITIPATGIGDQTPVIATESNAIGHFQLFKLVDGNVGSTSALATSANPAFVQFPGAQQVSQANSPWIVDARNFTQPVTGSVVVSLGGVATIIGSVNVAGSVNAVVAGSVNAVMIGSANATILGGNIAHHVSDSGNPVKVGGFAINSAFPTAVSSGDRVNFIADLKGRQIVTGIPQGLMQSHDNDWVGPLSGSVVWSAAPNATINVTNIVVSAGSGTSGLVTLFFARSGSTVMPTVGSGVVAFKAEFAPSATAKPGAVVPFGMFPCQAGAQNDALRIAISTSMQVYLQVKGYEET